MENNKERFNIKTTKHSRSINTIYDFDGQNGHAERNINLHAPSFAHSLRRSNSMPAKVFLNAEEEWSIKNSSSLSSSKSSVDSEETDGKKFLAEFLAQLRAIQDSFGNPEFKDMLESFFNNIQTISEEEEQVEPAYEEVLKFLTNEEFYELYCLIVKLEINSKITNSTNKKETTKLIWLSQVFYEVKAMSTWLTFRDNFQAILDHFNLGFNFLHPENGTDLSMSFHCTIFLSCFRETIEERLPMEEGLKSANKNVIYTIGECSLCFAEDQMLMARECCKYTICLDCLQTYVKTKVLNRQLHISCPNCDNVITVEEVTRLMGDQVERYYEIATDLKGSKNEKTCPNCFYITKKPARKSKLSFTKMPVTCERCSFVWCFKCQAPTHPGISCSKNQNSDFLLKQWSSQVLDSEKNIRKAQRCPSCGTMIERNDGCNHMTCSQCSHEFCYICLKRWILIPTPFDIPLFGRHSSRLGIAGCKQNLLPNLPVARKFIRGSLCLLEVTVGFPVAIASVAAALGLVIGLSPVLLLVGFLCIYCSLH